MDRSTRTSSKAREKFCCATSGVLLWRNAEITATARASFSECGRGWRLEQRYRACRLLRGTWTDGDVAARDWAANQERTRECGPSNVPRKHHVRSSASFQEECAETECEPEVFYETEESSLVHEEDLDNDDVLALEEYVAATERDMSQANRTWSEARQPLNDTLNAR